MPGETILKLMYGPTYSQDDSGSMYVENPKEPNRVIEFLKSRPTGTFVDFGCGEGDLLVEANKLGWRSFGVEFDPEVAAKVERQTGIRVFTNPWSDPDFKTADVLHLGDVIEHLTRLEEQMPQVLSLLKTEGYLLAQGPLEANTSLFTFVLSTTRRLRTERRTEMAPYHVLLATSEGQRQFFRRFQLDEVEYNLREVSWPAPVRLSRADLSKPRLVGMFAVRKLSKAVSAMRPSRWGNRYFYAGQKRLGSSSIEP